MFKKIKVSAKLWFYSAFFVFSICMLAILSFSSLKSVNNANNIIYHSNLIGISALSDAKEVLPSINSKFLLMLSSTDVNEVETLNKEIDSYISQINESIKHMKKV